LANELNLGYRSGATLTYGIYQPDGTPRVAAGTSLPEIGSTGYYTVSAATMVALDVVIVKEGTTVVAYGQYEPPASTPDALTAIAAVQTAVNTVNTDVNTVIITVTGLVSNGGRVNNNYHNAPSVFHDTSSDAPRRR